MKFKNTIKLSVVAVLLILTGIYLLLTLVQILDRRRMQEAIGFAWPKGTQELQWQYSGLQGSWMMVHLRFQESFHQGRVFFQHLDPSFEHAHDNDGYFAQQQYFVWHAKQKRCIFDTMKRSPTISTNLLFATSIPFGDKRKPEWCIVYDESAREMWIFCE